jgi:hypothetical protein
VIIAEGTAIGAGTPVVTTCALVPRLGIAMITSGRDFSASPPRVESVVSPFDGRVLSQTGQPLEYFRLNWSYSGLTSTAFALGPVYSELAEGRDHFSQLDRPLGIRSELEP